MAVDGGGWFLCFFNSISRCLSWAALSLISYSALLAASCVGCWALLKGQNIDNTKARMKNGGSDGTSVIPLCLA